MVDVRVDGMDKTVDRNVMITASQTSVTKIQADACRVAPMVGRGLCAICHVLRDV